MRNWIALFENTDEQDIANWRPPAGLQAPRPEDWEMFKKVRHVCRLGGGGGGYCHEVSEWIEDKYRWERVGGSYLSPDGEVCIAGHYWNVLPDGSILDCTADQTGEGHDMVLIGPDDPAHGRYDEEWYDDWHPGHEDYDPEWRASKLRKPFNGKGDFEMQDELEGARGKHWWATHPDQLKQYLRQQIEYAKMSGDEWADAERFERWLDVIEKRHPDA